LRFNILFREVRTSTPPTRSVVVAGAGVFGCTAALELTARGFSVTLVDRSPGPHPDASSTDISKMVRMDYGSDVFYHEFADEAIDGWERWNAEWPRPLYHEDGFLVLSSTPMKPGSFEYESSRVLTERGYAPPRLDSGELARRFPAWNSALYVDGYISTRGGWAESGAVVQQLMEECDRAGVTRVLATVTGIASEGSRASGVLTAEYGTLAADVALLCTGAWTPQLLPGLRPAIRTVAQPILHFGVDDPAQYQSPSFPPFAAETALTGWYGFSATPDGRVKLGHHSDGVPCPPEARGEVGGEHIELARHFLRRAIPSLAEAPVVGSRMCLYCDTFDGDLLVAHDPDREGLVVATGGSGHGFKFAPMLGPIIADAVERKSNRWLERFQWRETGPARVEAARHQSETGRES
jgi:glycine/D-amino acid oxidase-like deaminating enzyme